MINYTEKLNVTKVVAKEKELVSFYEDFESSIKEALQTYIEEFKEISFENDILKTMLLNNFTNAVFQVNNNLLNIQSLNNILDILTNQDKVSANDVDTYNKLCFKVDNDVELLQNFLSQTFANFENVPVKGKKKSIEVLNKCKEIILQKFSSGDATSSSTTSPSSTTTPTSTKKVSSRTLKKKFDVSSSDLLCFFPKKPTDNLVISTSQDNYTITFTNDVANIHIKDEAFNLSLKTPGVQISNSNTNNILFVSHANNTYTIITNNQIEIPWFIQVSRISKNDDFLEVEIVNNNVTLNVEEGIINFEENANSDSTQNNITKVAKTVNTNAEPEQEKKESIATPSKKSIIQKVYETIPVTEVAESQVEISDNDTLIISDSNKNVILPYKVVDLETKLKANKKYKSLQDVIQNEYTLPLETFKNPTKSRFREAFQLMKKKEHGSLKEAIELGFELMFQSDLNPAVIAACKDLDELDIYLDCLDDNELDKFSCFKIQYEIPPTTKGKK